MDARIFEPVQFSLGVGEVAVHSVVTLGVRDFIIAGEVSWDAELLVEFFLRDSLQVVAHSVVTFKKDTFLVHR